MTELVFGIIVLCWGAMSASSLQRYFMRRRPESLVIAVVFFWPVIHIARELKWLPRAQTNVFLAAGLVGGVVGLLVVLSGRAQK